MRRVGRRYCVHCGKSVAKRDEDGVLRDYCAACDVFFYDNPLPVVSTILQEDRRILLVKRKYRPYKGTWCLPSGFAEVGEGIEDAAIRELEEETGVKGKIVSLVDVDSCSNYFYGDLIFLTFEALRVAGKITPGSDTVAVKYYPIDKVPRLAFRSNIKASGPSSRTSPTIGRSSTPSRLQLVSMGGGDGRRIFCPTGLSRPSGKMPIPSSPTGSVMFR